MSKIKTGSKKEIEKKELSAEHFEELTNDLKRVQAEFENYKKRTEKESKTLCSYAKTDLIKKLLPVIDTFEAAIAATSQNRKEKKGEACESKDKGIELVYSQLMKTLVSEGLKEINAKGKFNPEFHEAMMQQESDEFDDDEIITVIQKGYLLDGIVIRPAKVMLNKKSCKNENNRHESKNKGA